LRLYSYLLILFVLLLILSGLRGQDILNPPLSSRIANYEIEVSLDARDKQLRGREIITWSNTDNQAVSELRFHLYLNGFRHKSSSFLGGMSRRRLELIKEKDLGGIDVTSLIVNEQWDLGDRIAYIQPDDDNPFDSTVISIPLPGPIRPGKTIQIEIEFICRLPRLIARTGYQDNFFMLGQWFPKIGVFKDGEWNCHQFFRHSEFFADFGTYDVNITLPVEYVVGSSGILLREEQKDSLKTLFFRAEDVHDFAFTAWPEYRRIIKTVNAVEVVLLYAPEHSAKVSRYFDIIETALVYTAQWLMPYPYPQLTIVDVPLYAYSAGGMEYPSFIICGSAWGVPESMKFFLEEFTVHEFLHQYFYGILASNEAEEPWLDEGLTSYANQKILSETYGLHQSASTFFNILVGAFDEGKKAYMRRPDVSITMKSSWRFKLGTYYVSVYSKPMLMLQTLENVLGSACMDSIMSAYIQRWEFKHPQTQDFLGIVQEYSFQDMQGFFQQALYDSVVLDYSVTSVQQNRDNAGILLGTDITVKRLGNFTFPVEIEYTYANGHTVLTEWNGIDSVMVLTVKGPDPVISARVDPGQKIWLDVNWTNNSFTVKDNPQAFYRHWLKALKMYQQILVGFFGF
jgi:hypothetical protein